MHAPLEMSPCDGATSALLQLRPLDTNVAVVLLSCLQVVLQHDDTSLQVAVSPQVPLAQATISSTVQAANPLRVWAMNDGPKVAALHAAVQTAVHPGAVVVAAGDGPMLTLMAARCSGVTLVVSLQVGSCAWGQLFRSALVPTGHSAAAVGRCLSHQANEMHAVSQVLLVIWLCHVPPWCPCLTSAKCQCCPLWWLAAVCQCCSTSGQLLTLRRQLLFRP